MMTKMLRINEYDQTIVTDCDLGKFEPSNDFIRDLVAEATQSGKATRDDAEGCPVTAVVWDAARQDTQAERQAYAWAVPNQDYRGTYEQWLDLSEAERNAYELGAAGIPTG